MPSSIRKESDWNAPLRLLVLGDPDGEVTRELVRESFVQWKPITGNLPKSLLPIDALFVLRSSQDDQRGLERVDTQLLSHYAARVIVVEGSHSDSTTARFADQLACLGYSIDHVSSQRNTAGADFHALVAIKHPLPNGALLMEPSKIFGSQHKAARHRCSFDLNFHIEHAAQQELAYKGLRLYSLASLARHYLSMVRFRR